VLDSNATPSGKICARLDGENHAGRDRGVIRIDVGPAPRDAWILVHFDSEPVAGPMSERLAEATAGEGLSRRAVDVETGSPRSHGRDRLVVRLQDGGVDVSGPPAGPTHGNGPGQVDAV